MNPQLYTIYSTKAINLSRCVPLLRRTQQAIKVIYIDTISISHTYEISDLFDVQPQSYLIHFRTIVDNVKIIFRSTGVISWIHESMAYLV